MDEKEPCTTGTPTLEARTGAEPGAGWLRRQRRKIATYGAAVLIGAGTAAVFTEYLAKYVPAWAKVTPSAQTTDGVGQNIVSRLGLEKPIEYVAFQLDGRLKRVNYDGTELDPNFRGYIPFQPETKIVVFARQEDGSYISKGITQGGNPVAQLDAKYHPGLTPNPGTADRVDLEGLTQIHLPAPKPTK